MERVWMKIGEAAKRVGVSPKDLRYWEAIIPEIQPRRSKGNLRYYHVDELERLERIHGWIREGLTVNDCRELLLRGQLATAPRRGMAHGAPVAAKAKGPELGKVREALKRLLAQLGS
jgi:DNA-binding transcriptional MerR regulator